MAKENAGKMPCQCCAQEVIVKRNERGTLSYSCQFCDDAPYQKPGTVAHKTWLEKITAMPGQQATAPVAPAVQPKPAPQSAGLLL